MTIASKLFYFRLSRSSRSSERETKEDDDQLHCLATDSHRFPSRCLRRSTSSGTGTATSGAGQCDRSLRPRHLHRTATLLEHESFRLDKRGTSKDGEARRISVPRVERDEFDHRLPCSVLQARARLLERLQGFHLVESRQQNSTSGTCIINHVCAEEQSNSDSGEWKAGTAAHLLQSVASRPVSILQANQLSSFGDMNKQPAIVNFSVLSWLQEEVFAYKIDSDGIPKGLLECSICLERFSGGEKLNILPCGHRFHRTCLEPWVQAHGVCPYCRSSIIS